MSEPIFKIGMKIENEKEFTKVLNDYASWNKRQPAEIVNAKLYFIALNALQTTKTTDKGLIKSQLDAPSNKYPTRTLGELLTAISLRAKNKKRLTAEGFAGKVEKLIKTRQNHVNFLRCGWLPTIKKLDYWNKRGDISFVKRYAPKKPAGVKQVGKDKGDVIPARLSMDKVKGIMWNSVGQGKQASDTVNKILTDGLNTAVNMELKSMKMYIEKKFNEQHDKLNKKII